MNIVFVLGEYYPNFSAVGKCAYRVANLLAIDNNVKVVCLKSNSKEKNEELINNQLIIRAHTNEYVKRELYIKKIRNSKKYNKLFFKALFNIFRMKKVMQLFFSKVTINKEKVNAFYNTLNGIEDKIDVIIPCCFPMESVVASLLYKDNHPNVKLIPYLFDPFTDSLSLHRLSLNKIIKRRNHLELEEKMLKKADKVIVMKHLYDHFINNFDYDDKIISAEHPLLSNLCNGNKYDGTIKLVYTGIFHNKVRHPKLFLDLIDSALTKMNAEFNIYAYGNCDHIIRQFSKNNPQIKFHGKVSSEEAEKALIENNIFVSIGNKDNTQVPSKIIEYMSYGKPIIHFYTNKEDKVIKILTNYELALLIDLNEDINYNAKQIIVFCSNLGSLNFNNLIDNYYDALPVYTVEKVRSIYENHTD